MLHGNTSLLQTTWRTAATHVLTALVRLCAIAGVSVKLLWLASQTLARDKDSKVRRISVVAHPFKVEPCNEGGRAGILEGFSITFATAVLP